MIQQLQADPFYALVMGFLLLVILMMLCGFCLLIKEIIESKWKRRYQELKDTLETGTLRLQQLGEQLNRKPPTV